MIKPEYEITADSSQIDSATITDSYAINAYIAKADKRLSEELENAGFADPENTVKHIDKLEAQIVEILKEQSESFEELLEMAEKEGVSLEEFLEKNWKKFKNRDDIKEKLFPVFFNEYSEYVPALAKLFIKLIPL